MLQFFDTLTDDSGNALLGATVAVTNFVGGAAALIYQSNGTSSPVANSTVVADITGQVSFYVPDGVYTLTYSYQGTVYKTRSPLQLLDPSGFVRVSDTGAANAYVISSSLLSAQLYVGMKVEFVAANTNTAASTININGNSGQLNAPGGAALLAGAIQAQGIYRIEWDGTQWQLLGSAVLTQATPYYATSNAETQLSIIPANYGYMVGDFLRYIVTWSPGQADTGAINSNALNTATKVAAYGKATLKLPAAPYTLPLIITQTWNCSASSGAVNTTNGGLSVCGAGKNSTFIQYQGSGNNTGVAWDMVGLAYGNFKEFTFLNGSASAGVNVNCANIALLQGALNDGGFQFSGINLWIDVGFLSYGDHIIWNAGCEQQHFIDCHAEAYSTAGSAQPFVFVAAGSAAGQTSAFQTIFTPVSSMTLIHWEGPSAAAVYHGPRGVVFHYTTAGAVGQIYFDDWCQSNYGGGEFDFMSDDSSSLSGVGCGIYKCGSHRMTLEVNSTNGDQRACVFNAAIASEIHFDGYAAAASAITASPFLFTATCVPTDVDLEWVPNTAGAFTAGAIALVQGTENGMRVRSSVPTANLISLSTPRTIGGGTGFGASGNGSDYSNMLGTHLVQSAQVNGSFCLIRTALAGNFVSASSNMNDGVQTTAAVSTSAVTILTLPNLANKVYVTGAAAGGQKFFDELSVLYADTTIITVSSQGTSTPAARTYALVSSNELQLTMASGTYAVQVTCHGVGMQA